MTFASANIALSNDLVCKKIPERSNNILMCKRRLMEMHTELGVDLFYYFMLYSQVLITQEASHPKAIQSISI